MLSAFLGQISGYFGKRFLFAVWFPSFLFGAAGVVAAATAIGLQTAVDTWSTLPSLTQTWLSVGGLVLITFFAYICDNLLGTMFRLYEGCWPEWAQRLRYRGVEAQRRQWQQISDRLDLIDTQLWNMDTAVQRISQQLTPDSALAPDPATLQMDVDRCLDRIEQIPRMNERMRAKELVALFHHLQELRCGILKQCEQDSSQQTEWKEKEAQLCDAIVTECQRERKRLKGEYDRFYAILYTYFPKDSEKLMPTRLGNTLKAAEEYSQLVYNFDAPTVWPRLFPLLPANFQIHLERSSTPLTTMLFTATLSLLFAVIGGSLLFVFWGSKWWLFSSTVIAGVVFAMWCYESAIHRAVEYGMLIRTAFDLYRLELFKALGVPIPPSPMEEWSFWPHLMQWWYYQKPPFDAEEGKPLWYYEGKTPTVSEPIPDEHVLYLKLGMPSKEDRK